MAKAHILITNAKSQAKIHSEKIGEKTGENGELTNECTYTTLWEQWSNISLDSKKHYGTVISCYYNIHVYFENKKILFDILWNCHDSN